MSRSRRRGIKRHESLKPLSRHHMKGLHVALKLSRTDTKESRISTEQIIKDAKEFWESGGQEHFREEEEILLPAYAQYANLNEPVIVEMLLEHVTLRLGMSQLLKNELSAKEMRELGKQLESHIRKEERIIFPMIEKALPEDKLKELAPYLHE